jgi:hypothetical protein
VTPNPKEVKTEAPPPVQLIPSTDDAKEFPPPPTAIHLFAILYITSKYIKYSKLFDYFI